MSATGILLAWKKELKLQPPSEIHTPYDATVSLNDIRDIAIAYADSLSLSPTINRIDYRPSKGVAKIRFEHHFTELQNNCNTGDIVSVKYRTADLIEMIHDGSILDYTISNNKEVLKLLYSTSVGFGIIILIVSGVYLWVRPRQIKKLKKRKP